MPKSILLAACALLVLPALAQERTKPKDAASVPQILDKAKQAFSEQRFGACLATLNEALGLVGVERAKAIRAALPAAPAGLEIVRDDNDQVAAGNPFAAAVIGGMGSLVQQEYRGQGASIDVSVTADSPLVQVFSLWVTNPSMLEQGAELIKYGSYSAVLKPIGAESWELQLLIDSTIVNVQSTGISDDQLLGFMSQAAVDQLARALAQ